MYFPVSLMRFIFIFISLIFVLSGCYQQPLALMGPTIGASQGKLIQSSFSTVANYAVEAKTGKSTLEHIFQREKDKIVNKVASIESEVIESSKLVKKKIINQKNNLKIKEKVDKVRWVLHLKEIKTVKQEEAFPANKPRYSYRPK